MTSSNSLRIKLFMGVAATFAVCMVAMQRNVYDMRNLYTTTGMEVKTTNTAALIRGPASFQSPSTVEIETEDFPRILHFIVFGESKEYMHKTIEWTTQKVGQLDGINVKVWNLEEVERDLMSHQSDDIKKVWELIKNPGENTGQYESVRLTRMSDFIRVLILYEHGGVYLDADTLPCRGLGFMFDDPTAGWASFGQTMFEAGQVLNYATSAPRHHPLFRKMLDLWVAMGPEVSYGGILSSTGPMFIAEAIDKYLEEEKHLSVPAIADESFAASDLNVRYVRGADSAWIPFADVRLAKGTSILELAVIHIGFRSWLPDRGDTKETPCIHNLDLIFPFLDQVCGEPLLYNAVFADCGATVS